MSQARPRHLLLWLFLVAGSSANAYEIRTHELLTEQAALQSVLQRDPAVLKDLGIEGGIAGQKFPNAQGRPLTIQSLLQFGVVKEDDIPRFTRHFYSPLTGRGMNAGNFPNQPSSPDWALAPVGTFTGIATEQRNSYWDARQALLNALTSSEKAERERNFGAAFQSLGHVIHHLQDMAQPQHTRNDPHCGLMGALPLASEVVCLLARLPHRPSLYEAWTASDEVRAVLGPRFDPGFAGYNIAAPQFAQTFNSPRRFWHTESAGPNSPGSGKGMAEFSNRNFVSAWTNFGQPSEFSLPALDPARKTELSIGELCSKSLIPCSSKLLARSEAKLTFFGSLGRDNYLGGIQIPFLATSTESIFDQHLEPTPGGQRVFALNRFNFDEFHNHLIPRAVAFSAGMIDYFFRGKIDLVVDPANFSQLLVKNLGAEPMKGRFALYYDDTGDVRKAVKKTSGTDLVWLTKDSLPPQSEGVLAAGGVMTVPADFVVPTDAKAPGEYMLVFDGDMGEEKADPPNGVVGAVAAKLIRPGPYRGALYVAGLDAQNRIVTFKVDPEGLRVLNGPDANGQLRFTPAAFQSANQRDIDPLFPIVQSHNGAVLPKLERVKQVEFESSGLGGMSHRTVALSLRNKLGDFLGYVLNSATGRLALTGNTMRWRAGSTDIAPGEFEFSPFVQTDGINGTLFFVRRFRPAPGQPLQTASGAVALPVFPGFAFTGENVNYVSYNGFKSGNLLVSPDGLTVSGFKTQAQENNQSFWNALELKLVLSPQPSVTLVQTEHVPTSTATPSPGNVNESTTIGPGEPPDQHWVTRTRQINNSESQGNDRKFFVDYISGGLVAWRDQTQSVRINEFIEDRTHDVNFDPDFSCPQTWTTDVVQSLRHARKSTTTTTVALDQALTSVIKDAPKLSFGSPINFTRNFTSHQVVLLACDGSQSIGAPEVVDDLVHDSDAQDVNPSFSGFTLHRTLNGRVDGSIVFNLAPPGTGYSIRGMPLGPSVNGFIADASPLGEVFVATTDKSVVVYDPLKSSGMPQTLAIPPHIVKLIAALWF